MRTWRRVLAALAIAGLGLTGYLDTPITDPAPLLAQSSAAFLD